MSEALLVRHDTAVATLYLNRPELHNAFDAGLISSLTAALEAAAADPAVRAVVLAGHGPSFSAGADLQWMRAMAGASQEENRQDALALARLMRTLDELPKPTIARVHGASFGLTESRLGLLPAVISPYVLAAIGPRQARRWFATGEHFDAADALRMGLVHQVVAADALDAAVQRQLELIGKAGPVAAASAKVLVREVHAAPADRYALDRANAGLIAALRASDEGREGLSAFLEKRPPRWAAEDRR